MKPPRYVRARSGSLVDGYEPRIREQLAAFPRMPATVIAERVGWPVFDPHVEWPGCGVASGRICRRTRRAGRSIPLGEIAQCDFWFPDVELPVGFGQTRSARLLPVLTMVCGYSRFALAMLLPSRSAEDLYAGPVGVDQSAGRGAPSVGVGWGSLRWGGGAPGGLELTSECQAFRGTLAHEGDHLQACRPGGQGFGGAAATIT